MAGNGQAARENTGKAVASKRIKVKVPLAHTDIGQAIIDYVENHKGARRPLWLQGIFRELKKQRKGLNRN